MRSKAAAASGSENILERPSPLPVSHWSLPHRHHHSHAHPHLKQDLMSTMQFSRPKSAHPQFSSHRHRSDAADCRGLQEYPDRQIQTHGAADSHGSHHRLKKLQDTCVEGMASSQHSSDSNAAASTAAHPATNSAVHDAEAGEKQSAYAINHGQHKADHAAQQQQLEQLQSCLPESSSDVLTSEASSSHTAANPESNMCMRRLGIQEGSEEHMHSQAGTHSRQTARDQQWPPKGARWRSASLYKMQARPMHVPTAKVSSRYDD